MLPRMVTTVLLPVLRTLLLRQVPTTFANRGAKRLLTTVRTVLLTLLRTIHDHGHDREPSTPSSCIRSGRAANGVEVNHGGKGFADRHHLLTKSLWKKRGKTGAAKSDKKRQRTCRNMTPFVAGNLPPVAARSDAHSDCAGVKRAIYRQTSSLSTALAARNLSRCCATVAQN